MIASEKGKGILVFIGAILWIITGILISLRPPDDFKGNYRITHDLLWLMGIGIMLIMSSLTHLLWPFRHLKRKLVIAAVINLLGSFAFLAGSIVVAINPGPYPYLLFSGFPLTTAGLIMTAIFGRQQKLFSTTVALTLVVMAVFLLFFNDQYMPWMASIFGGVALWLSYLLLFRNQHFRKRTAVERTESVQTIL